MRLIGRAADVLFIVTLLGYLLLLILSLPGTDLGATLPIGASGIKNITRGGYKTFGWFSDGAYFLFFLGNVKPAKKSVFKIATVFFLYVLLVTAFFIVFNGTFKSIGFRQKFALTETSKYSTVINNMGRFDYIGITCILFSSLFALSLPLFFAGKILNELLKFRGGYTAPFIVTAIILFAVILSEKHAFSLERIFTVFLPPAFFCVGNLFPVLLPLLKRRKNETEKN